MKLIMLCGQGGVGKSYFGKQLYNLLNNNKVKFIRMDEITETERLTSENFEKCFYLYIKKIQNAIDQKFDIIIIDFSHDSIAGREKVLNKLNNLENIDFITFSLRPGIENILKWNVEREIKPLQEVEKNYNSFEFPTKEEFLHFNFRTITNIIIDNSKNNFLDIKEKIL